MSSPTTAEMQFSREGVVALHSWTHESLEIVFEHSRRLTPSQFVQPVSGFGIACVRDQLVHILAAESGWISRLQLRQSGRWELPDFPDANSLVAARREVFANTQAWLRTLDEVLLNSVLSRLPDDWIGPARSPAFILHHVCTHAFHHKGQLAAMLRILGHPLPDTDLQR